MPTLSRATNLFVFLLIVSVLTASALIRIDKIVSAKGKLISDVPNIVIQPFDQTIIESIEVRAGDIVGKDQVLARLNATFAAADYNAMKDQVDLLSARKAMFGLGVPTATGGCAVNRQILDAGPGSEISATVAAATYCVRVFDPGTLTAPAGFSVRIDYP